MKQYLLGALRWLSFDADYSKLHLDTLGGLSFFDTENFLQGEHSLYISICNGNAGVRFVLGKRVDVYAGYSTSRIRGMGGATCTAQASDPISQSSGRLRRFP